MIERHWQEFFTEIRLKSNALYIASMKFSIKNNDVDLQKLARVSLPSIRAVAIDLKIVKS